MVLVPPSEGKASGGTGRFDPAAGRFPSLASARAAVLGALAADLAVEDDARRGKILGARGDLLERAVAALDDLGRGSAPALPAATRYTGVVWEHLDPGSLARPTWQRILVPSALLGVTAGNDPVPDHRLKFTVSLSGLGRLDRWWAPVLTEAIGARVRGRTVIDLLPAEHAAAIDAVTLASRCDLVRVRFRGADGRSAAGHAAKAVKGIAARAALDGGVAAVAGLRWQGWRARRVGPDVEIVAPD
jgi:uncharacterized protein